MLSSSDAMKATAASMEVVAERFLAAAEAMERIADQGPDVIVVSANDASGDQLAA
jgi:hypothetical protein